MPPVFEWRELRTILTQTTNFYLLSIAYLALPITTWFILRGRQEGPSHALWCLGNAMFAITLLIMSARPDIPPWIGFSVSSAIAYLSYTLRFMALDLDSSPSKTLRKPLLWVAIFSAFGAMVDYAVDYGRNSVIINSSVQAIMSFAIAWKAHLWANRSRIREINLIAIGYMVLGLVLVIRPLVVPLALPADGFAAEDLNLSLLIAAALVAAIMGNLGYLGACLSRYEDNLRMETTERAVEKQKLLDVELADRAKAGALVELETLLRRREAVVDGLVKEVLRPIQAVSSVLEKIQVGLRDEWDRDQAGTLLRRVETLLRRISTTVSNTVTEARYLDSHRQPVKQEVEIDVLLSLALAEMSREERQRMLITNDTISASARVDVNFLRAAFRNLIGYVLLKYPDDHPIYISISEKEETPTMVWHIRCALPSARTTLGDTMNMRKHHDIDELGLGMMIARRAISLHNGSIVVINLDDHEVNLMVNIPMF